MTPRHLVRVDVAQLVIGPDHIPGLSWPRIWLWAALLAATRLEPTPIEIEPIDNVGDWWRIRNGRHRYIAALLAGRTNLLAATDAAPR